MRAKNQIIFTGLFLIWSFAACSKSEVQKQPEDQRPSPTLDSTSSKKEHVPGKCSSMVGGFVSRNTSPGIRLKIQEIQNGNLRIKFDRGDATFSDGDELLIDGSAHLFNQGKIITAGGCSNNGEILIESFSSKRDFFGRT